MTDADLLRSHLEAETDAPVTGTFKRDTHLTDVALFKAKVLAVLHKYEHGDGRDIANIRRHIERIEL